MASGIAKGKAKVSYVLPEKLIERVLMKGARERKRASHIVERLILRGFEAEAADKQAASTSA